MAQIIVIPQSLLVVRNFKERILFQNHEDKRKRKTGKKKLLKIHIKQSNKLDTKTRKESFKKNTIFFQEEDTKIFESEKWLPLYGSFLLI